MLKTEVEELKKSNRLRNDEANSNSPLMSKTKISEIMELKKKCDTIGLKSPEEIHKKFNEYYLSLFEENESLSIMCKFLCNSVNK